MEQKTKVMEDILQAKAKCNPDFCEKEECLCVKKNHWPGQNRMGKLLSAIRDQFLQSKKNKKNIDSGNES